MSGPVMTMVRVHLRTGWLAILVWVLALAATMEFTVAAIHGLYDTPAKVHTYAAAVKGDALMMLNGRIAGIDSLGGIVANEFGFMASFAIPFMAVNLLSRMTRRNEEQGRMETLLAGGVGRGTPLMAAVLLTSAAEVVTSAALFSSLVGAGVPTNDAALYSLSMGALGLAFIGVASIGAQLAEHSRGVYAVGLGAIIAAYLLRGIGDVQWSPLTWLSPLGWQEQTRAFGDQRWWPLLIPLVVFGVLVALALAITDRRDVGSALIGARASDPTASQFLRTPVGLALRSHRGSLLGWVAATGVVSATFGSLAQPLVDAIQGNPSIASAMGAAGTSGLDTVLAMSALIMALMGAGYAIQAIGVLHAEEASGRLEVRLSGDRGRWAWLTVQLIVVAAGIAIVTATGASALAFSAGISVGHDVTGQVVRASIDFMPAVAFFGAVTVLVFTTIPGWQSAVWLVYAAGAVIAYLGDSLNLAEPILTLSPFHLIGKPPVSAVSTVDVTVLSLLAAACIAVGYAAFRRRGIPQT
jgi:ABC-2 type transport system permease protein